MLLLMMIIKIFPGQGIPLAVLEPTKTYLCCSGAEIKGMYHYSWPIF